VAGGYDYNFNRLKTVTMFDTTTLTQIKLLDLPFPILDDERFWLCHGTMVDDDFYVTLSQGKWIYRLDLTQLNNPLQKWDLIFRDRKSEDKVKRILSFDKCLLEFTTKRFRSYNTETNEINVSGKNPFPYHHVPLILGGNIFSIDYHYNGLPRVMKLSMNRNETPMPPIPMRGFYAISSAGILDRWIVVTGTVKDRKTRKKNPHTFIFDTMLQIWCEADVKISSPQQFPGLGNMVIGNSHIITIGTVITNQGNIGPGVHRIHRKYFVANWEIIGKYILLRALVDKDRAAYNIVYRREGDKHYAYTHDLILHKMMTDLNLDIFRYVLLFLV